MPDTKTTLIWLLRDQVSGPVRKIDASLAGAERRAGSSGGAFRKLGGALGGLINPTTLLIGGVATLTAFLVNSAKAAAEEEVNVAKMGAALEANIPNWNGNTDAIERLIEKRQDLAFTDDELRNSMALLVASTKDVEEAQDLQALAMDLARLKGVDLETATKALAKANAGSTRELKALGITLEAGATKTQIFAAIQKAAAGQAAAFADTTGGKWATLQIKFQNMMEVVGAKLIPVFHVLVDFTLQRLIPAIEKTVAVIVRLVSWIRNAVAWVSALISKISMYYNTVTTGAAGGGGSFTVSGFAEGGPVKAGQPIVVGEQGPELFMPNQNGTIIPNDQMTSGGSLAGVRLLGVSEAQIIDMVDRGLYFRLQRAAPTVGRT